MGSSSLKTLSEIFNDKIFRIPDYQRGYSWGEKQLNDFWIDLSNLDMERSHYTGMITVERKKEFENYHVIDGQQRLTTIMILLKVNLESFGNDEWIGGDNGKTKSRLIEQFLYRRSGREQHNVMPIFGYDKDNPSDIFYRSEILELESTDNFNEKMDTLYTQNLKNAKIFFTQKVQKLNKGQLEKIIHRIVKQLKFNFYEIDKNDGLDEYIIFETMNNRGKPLTTLELLKNRLIYLTTLLKNEDEEIEALREDINNVWKTVYQYLGKETQQKIEDDIFLKYHWRMYFGKFDRAIANPERDFLLKEHFIIQQVSVNNINYSDIKEYIINLQKAVVAYYNMLNPLQTGYSEEIKIWLSKINRLGFDTFKPIVMAILINKPNVIDEDIIDILKLIENYMFIKFKTMKGSGATIKAFFEFAYEYHKNKDIHGLIRKLDQRIYENHKNKLFNNQKFKELIKDLYFDQNGWYSWTGLKYLLYEYELHLQSRYNGMRKLQWEEINKDSVEHIFPQHSDKSCWNQLNALEKDTKHKILHSLGNLVLLSKSHNSSIGNKCFLKKREIFSTASYSTIEISKNENWTKEKIIEREGTILNFMSERWNLRINLDDNIERETSSSGSENSYNRIVQHGNEDNLGSKENKKAALKYLNEKTDYPLNNGNVVFSSINKKNGKWWFTPPNEKFKSDLYLVLYHNIESSLYFFHIQANSIGNPDISLFQIKNGISSIEISPHDSNFIDTKKGDVSFRKYFINKIKWK